MTCYEKDLVSLDTFVPIWPIDILPVCFVFVIFFKKQTKYGLLDQYLYSK